MHARSGLDAGILKSLKQGGTIGFERIDPQAERGDGVEPDSHLQQIVKAESLVPTPHQPARQAQRSGEIAHGLGLGIVKHVFGQLQKLSLGDWNRVCGRLCGRFFVQDSGDRPQNAVDELRRARFSDPAR